LSTIEEKADMEHIDILHLKSSQLASEAAKLVYDAVGVGLRPPSRIVLLLSGGSCIEVASEVLKLIPGELSLQNVTVALADERWVPVGSQDSNEQQLREKGVIQTFESRGARFIPMLGKHDSSIETASMLNEEYKQLFSENDAVLLLAGMGADGHTLGILPNTDASTFMQKFSGKELVTFYELSSNQDNPYKERLTLTFSALPFVTHLFLYATGANKSNALKHFIAKDTALHLAPVLGLYVTEVTPVLLTDITI
jgi:6-phosphogluconolactonase